MFDCGINFHNLDDNNGDADDAKRQGVHQFKKAADLIEVVEMNLDETQLAEIRQKKELAMKKAKEEVEAFKKAQEPLAAANAEKEEAGAEDKKKKKKKSKKKNAKSLAAFMDDDREADAFKTQAVDEDGENETTAADESTKPASSMLIEEVAAEPAIDNADEVEE